MQGIDGFTGKFALKWTQSFLANDPELLDTMMSHLKYSIFNLIMQMYGKLEQLSANNLQNLELINSSILVAILDDSCPETDDELLKIVLGGSGNFSDVWD